jgi:hypothetical protein
MKQRDKAKRKIDGNGKPGVRLIQAVAFAMADDVDEKQEIPAARAGRRPIN